jgi:hypothetical protein
VRCPPIPIGSGKPLQGPDGRRRHAEPPRDLVAGYAGGLQSKHFAHLAHRRPLCWHPLPPGQKPKERTLSASAEAPSDRRLPGRHHSGFAGDFARNQHVTPSNLMLCQLLRRQGRAKIGIPLPHDRQITGISDEMVAGRLRLWVGPSALRIASEQRLVLGALDHAQPRVVPVRSDQPQQLSLGSARRRPLDTG